MLTEECGLNPHLEAHGIEVTDTDLGEWIVQLRHEHPSHIVLPAIHIKKEEVGELFHERLGTAAGATDPPYLAEAARQHLRRKFLAADAGITGVNFAIAETGGFVVCTNEGNADLGVSLPKLHIACMGIEKLIPRAADLGRLPAAARPLGDRPADHHVLLALPRPDAGRRAAHRAGRQRPQRTAGQRRFPPLAQLHPLRRVLQHLPRLSPQRRAQLRRHRRRADRLDHQRRRTTRSSTRACRSRAACAARAPTSAR